MRLLYATSVTYPSTLANRIQTLAMARAFSERLRMDFFFGVRKGSAVALPQSTVLGFGNHKSIILAFLYTWVILRKKVTHVFCREERLTFFLHVFLRVVLRRKIDITFEAHFIPDTSDFFFDRVVQVSDRVVVLTSLTAQVLHERKIRTPIVVAPDGVDSALFAHAESMTSCRERLHIPVDKKVVMYCGHLYAWKGVATLGGASALLDADTLVYVVGGIAEDVSRFSQEFGQNKNLVVVGYRPHEEMACWMKAADVLVLPTSGSTSIGRLHTSPLKLFEYMASGVPIVASDVPSTREILSPDLAELVVPDDAPALARSIKTVLKDTEKSIEKARAAQKHAQQYSWDGRVSGILLAIQSS